MMPDPLVVDLSRLQFAATAMYHFLCPLTLGLSLMLAIMESVWRRPARKSTNDDEVLGQAVRHQLRAGRGHRHHDGVPVRHQLVLLSQYVGDIFGTPLAIEGLMVLPESTFVGLFFFGWERLSVKHLMVTYWWHWGRTLGAVDLDRQWLDAVSGGCRVQSGNPADGADQLRRGVLQPGGAGQVRTRCRPVMPRQLLCTASAPYLLMGRHIAFAQRSSYRGRLRPTSVLSVITLATKAATRSAIRRRSAGRDRGHAGNT